MLETGSDTGDHLGPAIYVDGAEVVFVCEMEAGWYRYISEWRFHPDGTIRPRFGFSAVQNSCVCHVHHHHVYWRLDFDIETAGNNVVEEHNTIPWNPITSRKWRVRNTVTNAGYEVISGATDGVADNAFGVGDLWVVRYRSNELDDGQGFTTDLNRAQAHLDQFVTGESVENQDIVVWYAAHFTHEFHENEVGHIVGPELKPYQWNAGSA